MLSKCLAGRVANEVDKDMDEEVCGQSLHLILLRFGQCLICVFTNLTVCCNGQGIDRPDLVPDG